MYTVDCTYGIHSGYAAGVETLEAAVVKAKWARDYYEALYPGTVRVGLLVRCAACSGQGRIGKVRKNARFPKFKDCVTCKASGWFPVPAVI